MRNGSNSSRIKVPRDSSSQRKATSVVTSSQVLCYVVIETIISHLMSIELVLKKLTRHIDKFCEHQYQLHFLSLLLSVFFFGIWASHAFANNNNNILYAILFRWLLATVCIFVCSGNDFLFDLFYIEIICLVSYYYVCRLEERLCPQNLALNVVFLTSIEICRRLFMPMLC